MQHFSRELLLATFRTVRGAARLVLSSLHGRSGRRRLLGLGALLAVAAVAFLVWVARDLPTTETFAARTVAQSTRLYDRTGNVLLYDIHGDEKRTVVALEDISPLIVNATLAAEDDRFFHHIGIDIPGIIRSFFHNLRSLSIEQGGSTITQQLVRNAVLTPEKTYARKMREVLLAIAVEARFSKEEILEAYLNQIPYGSLVYGAEAAAQTYFGKSARDVTLAEAATLAALPKAPSYYSPYGTHRDELLHRKNYVLDRMRILGYISAEDAAAAKAETPNFLPPRATIRAPHFVFYVQEELERRFGKERVEQGGLKVTTTLDVELQEIAEEAVETGAVRNERNYRGRNAALVALNPRSGEILAMVGSRDYFDPAYDGNVNVATRPRQPGSSFKPIVYAAAFERGFTPDTILFDVPTEFGTGGRSYRPQNYTGAFYGPVTARQALANSLNVASVKMLWLAGVHRSVELASRLGITTLTEPDRYGLSLVLGGGAVTLLEETAAFGVFATEGERVPTAAILRVEDHAGKVLFEHNPEASRVLDTQIARQINSILSDNAARALVFGTQTPLTLGKRPVAAKTGTAQDFRDAWTVGYTPSLVAGVWVGNNDYSPMARGASGSTVAAPIWNTFMRAALADTPIEQFTPPRTVITGKPILDGKWAIEEVVRIDRASGKLATAHTPPEWVEERIFRVVHDTLYWTDRSDPRGDPPRNPYDDPQFAAWEQAVQAWIQKDPELYASVTEKPPTEEDDIHVPENAPEVEIIEPRENERVPEKLTVRAQATAPLTIQTLVLSVNGELFGTMQRVALTDTYEKTVALPEGDGDGRTAQEYEITVRAFDPFGNRADDSVTVRLRAGSSPD